MRSLGFCLAGVRAGVGGLAGGLLLPRGGVRAPGVWPRLELAEDLRQVVRDIQTFRLQIFNLILIQLKISTPLLSSWTAPRPSQSPKDPPRSAKNAEMESPGM